MELIYIILSRFAHPACANLWRHAGDSFESALRLARPYLKYLNGSVFVQSPDDVVFVALYHFMISFFKNNSESLKKHISI